MEISQGHPVSTRRSRGLRVNGSQVDSKATPHPGVGELRPRLTMTLIYLLLGLCFGPACSGPQITTDPVPIDSPAALPYEALEAAVQQGDTETISLIFASLDEAQQCPEGLFLGRALLTSDPAKAARRFARSEGCEDPKLSAAALRYQGLARSMTRDKDLAKYFPLALELDTNPWIDDDDRARMWTLAAIQRELDSSPAIAIDAYGRAYEWALVHGPVDLIKYTQAAATRLARQVDPGLSLEALVELSPLAQASIGAVKVRQAFNQDDPEGARVLLDAVRAPLIETDQSLLLAELETLLNFGNTSTQETILGVVLPLSGSSRRVGRTVLAGVLQAQGAFFPGSSGRITMVFRDSASSPEVAQEAIRELNEMGAVAILGPLATDVSQAAALTAAELGLPMLSLALGQLPAEVLNFAPSQAAEIDQLARAAMFRGRSKVLVLAPETPYGDSLSQLFANACPLYGLDIVDTIRYPQDESDFRKLAKKIAKIEALDTLFIADTGDKAVLIASFLAQENIWSAPWDYTPSAKEKRRFVSYLGPAIWLDAAVLEDNGRYLNGALFVVPYAPQRPGRLNALFVETFNELYQRDPGFYEALAFDATRLLRKIITDGARDPDSITQAINDTRASDGVTGRIGFVEGKAHPEPLLLEISGEGPVQAREPQLIPETAPSPSGATPTAPNTPEPDSAALGAPAKAPAADASASERPLESATATQAIEALGGAKAAPADHEQDTDPDALGAPPTVLETL